MLKEMIKKYCYDNENCSYLEKEEHPCLVVDNEKPNAVLMQFMLFMFFCGIYTPSQIIDDFSVTETEDGKTIYCFTEEANIAEGISEEEDIIDESMMNMAEYLLDSYVFKENSSLRNSDKNILRLALEYFTLDNKLPSASSRFKWEDDMDDVIIEATESIK